jgi:hypothetical protein
MWTLFLTNLRFPNPESTTTARLVCRVAKLCAKGAIACLASSLVKRIRTEEPDEVVLHVRICGECAGQPVHLPGSNQRVKKVYIPLSNLQYSY